MHAPFRKLLNCPFPLSLNVFGDESRSELDLHISTCRMITDFRQITPELGSRGHHHQHPAELIIYQEKLKDASHKIGNFKQVTTSRFIRPVVENCCNQVMVVLANLDFVFQPGTKKSLGRCRHLLKFLLVNGRVRSTTVSAVWIELRELLLTNYDEISLNCWENRCMYRSWVRSLNRALVVDSTLQNEPHSGYATILSV